MKNRNNRVANFVTPSSNTKPNLGSLLLLSVQSIMLQRSLPSSPTERLKPGPTAAAAAASEAATTALDGTLDPSEAAVDNVDETSETISSTSPSITATVAAYLGSPVLPLSPKKPPKGNQRGRSGGKKGGGFSLLEVSVVGGGRTYLWLAQVIWPLTMHPFQGGARGGILMSSMVVVV